MSIGVNKLIDPTCQVERNKKQGGVGIRLTALRVEQTTLIIGYSAIQKGTHNRMLFLDNYNICLEEMYIQQLFRKSVSTQQKSGRKESGIASNHEICKEKMRTKDNKTANGGDGNSPCHKV